MSDKKLKLTFDPSTIEHLGIKMYSTLPPALAELIANAYDACAKEAIVSLYDDPKKIIVKDNGCGMTFDEVNEYYLKIGRNRRKLNQPVPCDRFPTGKKGLGKLALFGLGKKIEVITKKNGEKTSFSMIWDEIINAEGEYTPKFTLETCDPEDTGTEITVSELKRKTPFNLDDVALSLAKLFNFYDENFRIIIELNEKVCIKVDRELRYSNLSEQFTWSLPNILSSLLHDDNYEYKNEIKGKIFTTEKPLKPGMRGITLYANGRLVNLPEFFGVSESSHFFSYATGYIDVDFIDRWDEDVISTDRQSLDWDNEKLQDFRAFLQRLILAVSKDWREKRKEKNRNEIQTQIKIDINEWFSKTPNEIKEKLEQIVNPLTEAENGVTSKKQANIIKAVHDLVPEYPYYHWRHLHETIHTVSREDYQGADYLRAAVEAAKKYENIVKEISGLSETGVPLMNRAYGNDCDKKPIQITPCESETHKNIEEGQRNLSAGLISGFRNPVSHEPKVDIHPSIFNDKDCLDILSLISYLLRKLDQRVKPSIKDEESDS